MRTDSLAKLSIGVNFFHTFLSLLFCKQFFPNTTPAFPGFVQILFWIEFGLAGIVVTRILDRIISSKATQSDVEAISVTHVETITPKGLRSISTSDWRWTIAAALSFICLCAIMFLVHPPKFVQ